MSILHKTLTQTWLYIQGSLFSWLKEKLGVLTKKQQELVTTLETLHIEEFIYSSHDFPGRPPKDRTAIARVFVAKMVYNTPTTHIFLDRLSTDISFIVCPSIPHSAFIGFNHPIGISYGMFG